MAERRMFAKTVIGSARFLRMPVSARLLYYDLGMQADDDGVVEAFAVMRTTGASEDDLRVLVTKGFVRVLNEDLVTYIMDWSRNNLIKKDRYHPSVYAELIRELPSENDSMVQFGTQMEPDWNPNGTQMEPQVRLGKDRLGKVTNNTGQTPASFDRFWAAYPKKIGKQAALKAFKKIKNVPIETMLSALEAQKQSDQWTRDGGQYIPNPSTWLNQGRWEDELPKQTATSNFLTGFESTVAEDEIAYLFK